MITVLHPGMLTTVQDCGRTGYQRFGVPVCGAMDGFSLSVGNLLVGNEPGEGALELTGIGPNIRFDSSDIFALSGASFDATLNGAPIECNRAYLAHSGDVLECGVVKEGFRGYLCFAGGLDIPKVMESQSTCLSAHFGGFQGRKLQINDQLGFRNPQYWLKGLPERKAAFPAADYAIRVVLGPQDDSFSEEGLRTFFSSEYRLSTQSDRMGCRLEGEPIALRPGMNPNIVSDGVAMGCIQVPNGQPIVMMADRQTTGGYVKLGAVISADLGRMAQKKPGDPVCFVQVTLEEAYYARMEQRRLLCNLRQELEDSGRW